MHHHVLVLDRVRLVTLPIRPRGRAAINAFSRSGTTEAGAVVVLLVSMEMGDWDLPLPVQAGLFAQSSVPARYLMISGHLTEERTLDGVNGHDRQPM
jgi:hypothetical protein